jgi:hypothetical protein
LASESTVSGVADRSSGAIRAYSIISSERLIFCGGNDRILPFARVDDEPPRVNASTTDPLATAKMTPRMISALRVLTDLRGGATGRATGSKAWTGAAIGVGDDGYLFDSKGPGRVITYTFS